MNTIKKVMFTIDTTINPINYPSNLKKIYENNLIAKRKIFLNWLGIISKKYTNNIEWWVLNPPSRDSLRSKLFHNYCLLESIKEYLKIHKKKKTFFVVNKFIFSELSKKINFNIILKRTFFFEIKNSLSNLLNFFKFTIKTLVIFLFIKLFKKDKKIKKPIILIDTFINYYNSKVTNIYGEKFVNKANKKRDVFFVPSFAYVSLFSLSKILFNLSNNKKYIFKDEFISFFDLFDCFTIFLRKKKFKDNFTKLNGWNLTDIVNSEISTMSSFDSIVGGLLNYKFAKGLSKQKVSIKKTINWFENQSLDKGWNFGFRLYHKKCKVIGYQGSSYFPHFFHISPSNYEFNAKVVPSKIIVIGDLYKKVRKEFCSKIKIITGPAIRFNQNSKSYSGKKIYNILFVLSGIKEIDEILLEKAIIVAKILPKEKIFIKSHPILSLSKLKKFGNLPYNIIQSLDSLDGMLKKTHNVISAGPTSAVLECLIYNCNLIIYKVSIYEKILVKQINLPKKLYKVINSDLELEKYIKKHFFKKKKLIKESFKKKLFQPENKKNLNLLLT